MTVASKVVKVPALNKSIYKSKMSTCPICYEDITAATGQVALGCTHSFHLKCVVEWLISHETCPCCRREVGDQERVSDLIDDGEDESIEGADIWPPQEVDGDEEQFTFTNVNHLSSLFRAEIMAHLPNPEDFENIIDIERGLNGHGEEFTVTIETAPGATTEVSWTRVLPAPAAGPASNSWIRDASGHWRLASELPAAPAVPAAPMSITFTVDPEPLGTLSADAAEFIPAVLTSQQEAARKIQAIVRGWRTREMVRAIRSN